MRQAGFAGIVVWSVVATVACGQGPGTSPAGAFRLFTTAAMTTSGLVGSYVNQDLRGVTSFADWRTSHVITGTRVDPQVEFRSSSWGVRAQVGLTGGSDADWDQFSAQWDGWVQILWADTQLCTLSDDSSRLWIDVNGDGVFQNAFPELVNDHWGTGQGATVGEISQPLAPGLYRIRVQYEEGSGANVMVLRTAPTVRIAYLIPSNRTAQPNAVAAIRGMVQLWQTWFCDQFERYGYLKRQLRIETELDGVTPKVHVLPVAGIDTSFHADPWSSAAAAATAAGVHLWEPGEVWLLVPESHVEQADGSILGGVALGGSNGSGPDGGVAVVGSASLSLMNAGGITSNTNYQGLVVPAVGPYPLVQSTSFPWFEGSTISSVVSSLHGAALHELCHALGIPHDWRNDANFLGNLMFNGLRGFRGAAFPALYPAEECRLGSAAALALATSPYLRDCAPHAPVAASAYDAVAPAASISTAGTVTPVNGLLPIVATVSDNLGLASVILDRNGEAIEEQVVTGTSAVVSFATPWFDVGSSDTYGVTARDRQGNLVRATTTITPAAAQNLAPKPYLNATPAVAGAGGTIILSAAGTTDPNGNPLVYEWDLDGDLVWDTPPSASQTYTAAFATSWPRVIRVRVTDSAGARSISAPAVVRVTSAAPSGNVVVAGSGTPSCLGPITLLANVPPTQGSTAFGLVTAGAPPLAAGFIALAQQPAPAGYLAPGLLHTSILINPSTLVVLLGVNADASGHQYLPLTIPSAGFANTTFSMQSIWPGTPACPAGLDGFGTSNRLTLTIQ